MASSQFSARAAAVIEVNACGREDDYLAIREQMRTGDFRSEGEDLGHILVAKMAFIRAHVASAAKSVECHQTIFRLRKNFDEHGRVMQLFGTSACAREIAPNLATHTDPEEVLPVEVTVSIACMSEQVNQAIVSMQKKTQLGSSGLPCISDLEFIVEDNGEWDVNNRELVRMLYLSGSNGQRNGGILSPSTIDYMYLHLLAARGKLSDGSYPTVLGCDEPAGDQLGSPEDTADRHAWYRDVADALGDFFDWAAITYITYGLVPGGGALIVAPFLLSGATGASPGEFVTSHWDVRIPESENHRLMIETSKFLTNADIIARLDAESYDRVDDVREDQAEVRDWLIRRLQDIAQHDFIEYNARPYSRYSLNSILNLHDFAAVHGDADLAKASRIVLDLAEAKFAATSNRGRRIVPFRRLSGEDGDDNRYLYESISGSDHEIARAMLLAGQTQTLDKNRADVRSGTLAEMVNAATSSYQLPPPVLATIVERGSFEQTIRHAGVERVEQSPAFTISAGGVPTEPTGKVLGKGNDKDRGIAMPTVIIPTLAGAYMRDLFRFDGIGVHDQRSSNTCVAAGFACGVQPKFPAMFDACTKQEVSPGGDDTMLFISSAECLPGSPGPHFYLAARHVSCPQPLCPTEWGVMDIVEAKPPIKDGIALPDPAYDLFRSQRRGALIALTLDADGRGTYVSAAGQRIRFGLNEFGLDDVFGDNAAGGSARVLSIDDNPPPPWKTAGGVLDADPSGRATIKGTGGPVTIDFSDRSAPSRLP